MSLRSPEKQFDGATALGILLAFAMVLAAIALSGTAYAFMDMPSLLIVVGGTFAVVMACFTLGDISRSGTLVVQTVLYPRYDPIAAAESILELARHARKQQLLTLQNNIAHGKLDPFMDKGLAMVVDGVESEKLYELLIQDVRSLLERHSKGVAIFRKAAEIAPAMGLIGTLIGLVQMLGNLDDPSKIGPAMAVALLTTLYGALLAYVVFIPLATKLERNTQEEVLVRQIQLEGILSIARQENPRKLEIALATILPPIKPLEAPSR